MQRGLIALILVAAVGVIATLPELLSGHGAERISAVRLGGEERSDLERGEKRRGAKLERHGAKMESSDVRSAPEPAAAPGPSTPGAGTAPSPAPTYGAPTPSPSPSPSPSPKPPAPAPTPAPAPDPQADDYYEDEVEVDGGSDAED
jgi:hypothetical protein